MNFPSWIFFNDFNHGYGAAILKKTLCGCFRFIMVVATYFYYEKVRRTMRTAIVSYLRKLNNVCMNVNEWPFQGVLDFLGVSSIILSWSSQI